MSSQTLLNFYLHEPTVVALVEFFHSLLATMCGADTGSQWTIMEEDPGTFLHYDAQGRSELPCSDGLRSAGISPEAFVNEALTAIRAISAARMTSDRTFALRRR
jgi:hypothetical protein